MNGRIYDPHIARFMQADPLIQDPANLQNFDRYQYCFNSPTTCTDPSGLFSQRFLRLMDPLGIKRSIARTSDGYRIGSILITVGSYWCTFAAAALCNGFGQAAWAGYAGASSEQQTDIGVRAGRQVVVNQLIGSTITNPYLNTLAHVAVGCYQARSDGGQCADGARAALVSELVPECTACGTGAQGFVLNLMYRAAAGGLASVAGGGKFGRGAESAAYSYLFNCSMHAGCGSSPEETSAPIGKTLDAPFTTVEQYVDFGGKAALTVAITVGPQFAIATLLDASGATLATVTTNQIAGNAFRDEIAALLQSAGYQVRTEVSKSTIFGRRVIDIDVWKNGVNLGGIETKLGNSVYHAAQRAKDAWLQLYGYIVNVVRGPK